MLKQKNYFFIFVISLFSIGGFAFAQTPISPTIIPATESSTVVTPSSEVPTPNPVIVEDSTSPDSNSASESSSLVTPSSEVPTPNPVIVEDSTNPDSNPASESNTVVSPSIFSKSPESSEITKTTFSIEGNSFVPEPVPVITSSEITKTTFSFDGDSFLPQPIPVITSSKITKTSFSVIGEDPIVICPNTANSGQADHDNDGIPDACDPNTEITTNTVAVDTTLGGDLTVDGASFTIPFGITVEFDFANNKIIIKNPGGKILVQFGGKIT